MLCGAIFSSDMVSSDMVDVGIKVFGFLYSIKRCFLVELQPEKWFGIRSGVQKLMFFKYDSIFGSEATPKIPNFDL